MARARSCMLMPSGPPRPACPTGRPGGLLWRSGPTTPPRPARLADGCPGERRPPVPPAPPAPLCRPPEGRAALC